MAVEETTEVEESNSDVENFDDVDATFEDESETDEPEAATEEETEEEEPTTEPTETEETEDEAATESEEPEVAEEPKDDIKARNKEMAEKRIQERAEREAKLKAEQQEYVAQADEDDPRDLAVRQLQVDAYNNKVEANTNKLTNGYERALKDFDILRDSTPEIQDELASAIDAFQAMNVTVDKFGNPTEVRGDLYAYLQAKADSIQKLTGIRSKVQEQNKAKEKSKVLATPTRAPKTPKVDPDLAGFDEEASRW